ncbi:MAG: hypothetical protein ACRYGP_21140 [Janthinobacterium lividum]
MTRPVLFLVLLVAALSASAAQAQTANSSPTSGGGAGGGNVTRTAPSGSTAIPTAGQPQAGAPTPVEQHEEQKSQKETTSVCKGC